ncbi:MAG: hypothetical protein ABW278_05245 [Steroidobacteraceae bacterium]
MAKVNFRQQKRQKEIARKQRQDERLLRRGEKPVATDAAVLSGEAPKIDGPGEVTVTGGENNGSPA